MPSTYTIRPQLPQSRSTPDTHSALVAGLPARLPSSQSVQSRQGEGTTFTLKLPVEHETLADPSHTHGPAR